jgi:hypothetical protein
LIDDGLGVNVRGFPQEVQPTKERKTPEKQSQVTVSDEPEERMDSLP